MLVRSSATSDWPKCTNVCRAIVRHSRLGPHGKRGPQLRDRQPPVAAVDRVEGETDRGAERAATDCGTARHEGADREHERRTPRRGG